MNQLHLLEQIILPFKNLRDIVFIYCLSTDRIKMLIFHYIAINVYDMLYAIDGIR